MTKKGHQKFWLVKKFVGKSQTEKCNFRKFS